MMELTDLRVFVRITKTRSLSAAARSMNLPKSSLSRALTRLEGAVGAVLIERSTRHLRLTDAGSMLLPHALRILDAAEEAQAALDGLAEIPRGTLKISVTHSFAVGMLTPMLSDFMRRYPEVRVVLDIGNRPIDLAAEEIDLALRIGPLADSELIARRLATIELWTCASPAYLRERGIPKYARDLVEHNLLTRANHVIYWQFRTTLGETVEVEVLPGTVIPEPAALLEVLIGGSGIGRLPEYLAAQPIADGKLARVLPDLRPETVEVHALYARSLTAKTRVFIEALSEHLAAMQITRDRR
jgi:DNA-binding transcriptional LysR family regulator